MEIPISFVEESISRGDILLSEFDGIDHRKFFVVMGVSKDKVCGFFFINSNIHPAIFNKQVANVINSCISMRNNSSRIHQTSSDCTGGRIGDAVRYCQSELQRYLGNTFR